MKIVFLNGPPRSGKDFAASVVDGVPVKLAARLKEMTHQALNLVDGNGMPLPHDWFEDRKDIQLKAFGGVTPRAAYIAMSEGFIKPLFGDGALGMWLADEIENAGDRTYLITDSGFREEAEKIVERFGAENCLLVRIARSGCSFEGDSRGYINLDHLGVTTWVVWNNGDDTFAEALNNILP